MTEMMMTVAICMFYLVLSVIVEAIALVMFAKENKCMAIVTIILGTIGTIVGAPVFIESYILTGTMKVVFGVLSATMVAFVPPIAVDILIIKISEFIKERKFFY